jgi:hypothetical protein
MIGRNADLEGLGGFPAVAAEPFECPFDRTSDREATQLPRELERPRTAAPDRFLLKGTISG